jgi:hypothetical protein
MYRSVGKNAGLGQTLDTGLARETFFTFRAAGIWCARTQPR